jgi:signal transduction histidine kinase
MQLSGLRGICKRLLRVPDMDMLSQNLSRESEARKAAENQLQKVSAELHETSAALEHRTQVVAEKSAKLHRANEDIEQLRLRLLHPEKMAKVGLLTAGIADEITQPLTFITDNLKSVNSYLESIFQLIDRQTQAIESSQSAGLLKTATSRTIRRFKKQINFYFIKSDISSLLYDSDRAIARAQAVVEDIVEFSAVGRREMAEEEINMLLDKSLNLASNELHFKADIVKQYGRLPNMLCDRNQLIQAFLNLLLNAVDSIETKGTITLRTGTHSPMIWCNIVDTGVGISDEHLGKIFNPFFTTKTSAGARGLGLQQVQGAPW